MIVEAVKGVTNFIGRLGENEARVMRFPIREMLNEFPGCTFTLANRRPNDADAYPSPNIAVNGDFLDWTVTSGDLTSVGFGECEVIASVNDQIVKSEIYQTVVKTALDGSGTVPEPWESWVTQVTGAAEQAEAAVEHYPQIEDGVWMVWDVENETWTSTGIQAEGEDGVSPTVSVVEISGGHRVTITDSEGDHTFDVMDGTGGGGTSDYNDLSNKPQIGGTTLSGNKSLSDLGIASASDVSAKYTKPGTGIPSSDMASAVQTSLGKADTAYQKPSGGIPASDIASGVIPDPTSIIDDTAGNGDTNKVWSADKVNELKSAINATPEIKDSDTENVDIDISDPQGNVVVRIAGGHIQTKNFDSSNIIPKTKIEVKNETTDESADFYLADLNGNGLVALSDGQIKTKYFSSDNGLYESRFEYTSEAGTETISHFFPAGTKLSFHLTDYNDRARDGIRSNKVSYKYTDTSGTTRTLGTEYGYDFPVYVLQYDAVSVSVQYGDSLSYSDTVLSFKVYSMASFPRTPNVLTVRASGGKDFTSLRAAVEYARQYADELNRFEIQIYPGTYDILSYYTAEEISVEGFIGLLISNGISLVGVGHRSEVILTATMSTDDYTLTQRNYVSTLNIKGNTSIRNLTVKAENIRYAVHDDLSMMPHQTNTHIFECVTFVGKNLTSSSDGDLSYGAGGADMKKLFFINCDFSDALTLHTTTDIQHEYTSYFINCRARLMQFGDYNSGIPTHVYLKNCNVSRIRLAINGTHDQYMLVEGEGTNGVMVESPVGYVYALDNVHKFAGSNISAGTAVKLSSDMSEVSASTAINTIYGISLGVLNGTTYVQTDGWLNSNTLGISGLSVGDYLTIDGSGAVVSGGTSANAIAVVKHINSNSVAFAKLLI